MLHHAAIRNRVNIIEQLGEIIENYGEEYKNYLEVKDDQNRTPLFLAAMHSHEATVTKLLELKCEQNVIDKKGQKAIYWIISECIELVLFCIISFLDLI